jgi:hypothetical protein
MAASTAAMDSLTQAAKQMSNFAESTYQTAANVDRTAAPSSKDGGGGKKRR